MGRTAPSDWYGPLFFSRWVGLKHTQMFWFEEQFAKYHIFLSVLVTAQRNSKRGTELCGTAYYIITLRDILALVNSMALRYQPEGSGFDFWWCHWLNPSGHTLALRSTQPVIGMITRGLYFVVSKGGPVLVTTLPPSGAECLVIWKP